ncbi:MAG: M23 family metallopeptidase [Gammaproteobacteria bacterium]|nr:M23 family metallopeptidase [Gammaproteobacteria bacterium]
MELILLSKRRGHLGHIQLTSRRVWLSLTGLALLAGAGVFYGGFQAATHFGIVSPVHQVAVWRADLAEQAASLEATQRDAKNNLDALALRLGQMNAHVVRLDALGQRLTQMAGLEDGEFDFAASPPLGGPEELVSGVDLDQVSGLISALNSLDQRLGDRQQQLSVLEDFLLNRKLQAEVLPEGRPVSAGYISSGFGNRTDPFTGRAAFHKGIDFAGREGADVIAVASGVVIWSGDRYGYGQMVEVNHGNGYVTRYAHNSENLVVIGDTVKRGEIIGTMGSTGRATGPNLHFEVLRNGRVVDPLTYIN